ncbi:MAG: DMT family transporter [Terriglobales bacterium]
MPIPAGYLPAAYSLTAMGIWGASDFLGGVGARRANAFLFTAVVHLSGVVLMGSLALLTHAPFPGRSSVLWCVAAGSVGGISLALFYRALASGKMGLTAPVAAVLGAGIPTVVTAFVAGFPGYRHVCGFVLAAIGVWLISRDEDGAGRPEGVGLAVLAGVGFAGFYLCIKQAGDASALWIAFCSRMVSFLVTGLLVLMGRHLRAMDRQVLAIAVVAGCFDITGSALFIRAAQTGRLDAAVVLSSLYPVITVLLARFFLHEHFSRSKTVGMLAALAAVPLVAG